MLGNVSIISSQYSLPRLQWLIRPGLLDTAGQEGAPYVGLFDVVPGTKHHAVHGLSVGDPER